MFEVTIHRTYKEKVTTGNLVVKSIDGSAVWACVTIELPWKNNLKQKSCIPEGGYEVVPRYSQKYKDHYHVLGVPNRELILIHPANYVNQLKGCIAVGKTHADLDKDGVIDVTSSRDTMQALLSIIKNNKFNLLITKS